MIGIILYLLVFGGFDILGSSMHILNSDCITLQYTAEKFGTAEDALEACEISKKNAMFNIVYFIVMNVLGFMEVLLYVIAVIKLQLPLDEFSSNLMLMLPSCKVYRLTNSTCAVVNKSAYVYDLKQAFYSDQYNTNLVIVNELYSDALFQTPNISKVMLTLSTTIKFNKVKGVHRWNIIRHFRNLLSRDYLLVLDAKNKIYQFRLLTRKDIRPKTYFKFAKLKRLYIVIKDENEYKTVNDLNKIDVDIGSLKMNALTESANMINKSSKFLYSTMKKREDVERALKGSMSMRTLLIIVGIAIIGLIILGYFMNGGTTTGTEVIPQVPPEPVPEAEGG